MLASLREESPCERRRDAVGSDIVSCTRRNALAFLPSERRRLR
jgi:hypothetical protein